MSVCLAIHPSKKNQLHKSLHNKQINKNNNKEIPTKPGKKTPPQTAAFSVLINVPILWSYVYKTSSRYKWSISAAVTKYIIVIQWRWKEQGVPGDRLHSKALHHTVRVSPFGFCSISCDAISVWWKIIRKAKQNLFKQRCKFKVSSIEPWVHVNTVILK